MGEPCFTLDGDREGVSPWIQSLWWDASDMSGISLLNSLLTRQQIQNTKCWYQLHISASFQRHRRLDHHDSDGCSYNHAPHTHSLERALILNHSHNRFYWCQIVWQITFINDLCRWTAVKCEINKALVGDTYPPTHPHTHIHTHTPPGAPGGSTHPPLPAYSISNPARTDGVESDLLDSIPPSSDLYAQPIRHRW